MFCEQTDVFGIIEQIRELENQGLQEIMWATGNAAKWRFAEDFARQVIERY